MLVSRRGRGLLSKLWMGCNKEGVDGIAEVEQSEQVGGEEYGGLGGEAAAATACIGR